MVSSSCPTPPQPSPVPFREGATSIAANVFMFLHQPVIELGIVLPSHGLAVRRQRVRRRDHHDRAAGGCGRLYLRGRLVVQAASAWEDEESHVTRARMPPSSANHGANAAFQVRVGRRVGVHNVGLTMIRRSGNRLRRRGIPGHTGADQRVECRVPPRRALDEPRERGRRALHRHHQLRVLVGNVPLAPHCGTAASRSGA